MTGARVTKPRVTKLCACGCGRHVEQNETGRPRLHFENACRQSAYRQRVARTPLEEREGLLAATPCELDELPLICWEAADHDPLEALRLALDAPELCGVAA